MKKILISFMFINLISANVFASAGGGAQGDGAGDSQLFSCVIESMGEGSGSANTATRYEIIVPGANVHNAEQMKRYDISVWYGLYSGKRQMLTAFDERNNNQTTVLVVYRQLDNSVIPNFETMGQVARELVSVDNPGNQKILAFDVTLGGVFKVVKPQQVLSSSNNFVLGRFADDCFITDEEVRSFQQSRVGKK